MPEAYESSLSDIFEASKLRIPLYQRSYAWESQQVNDVLGDIDYIDKRMRESEETNLYHYFGTLVLDSQGEFNAPGTEDWEEYDIIDGQQRLTTVSLLMSVISEELDRLQKAFDDTGVTTDDLPPDIIDNPGRKSEAERRRYVKKGDDDTGRHLSPAQLTEKAYKKLVVFEQSAEKTLENEDLVPAQKLARAKKEIENWLRNKRNSFISGETISDASDKELIEYYQKIHRIVRILNSKFLLTVHEVPSADEAGRLFEAVNDRGRDITLADKIRSYLIYVSGEYDALDTTEVAHKFNQAVETVALHADDDTIVDQFVRYHWELFTGEHRDVRKSKETSEIHRRIKHVNRHASMDRGSEDVVNWVETYSDSLQDAADAFVEARYLNVFLSRYEDVSDETISKLCSLHNYNFSNLAPLMMALLITTNPGDNDFARIVSLMEAYSFRVYQVMKRSTRIGRREFKQSAHRLYVAGYEDNYVEELMGGAVTDEPYDSIEEAIPEVAEYIDSFIGQHCPDDDFITHLTRTDIISGADTRGWPGFCNKSAIRYLLYEYERHLRIDEGSDSLLNQLPSVTDLNEEFTLEHIAPRNPGVDDARLENHENNVNRLANMALLGPEDNKEADNDKYRTKYEQVYQKSGMLMLKQQLPDPDIGWSVEQINDRESKLVDYCLNRWSGESTAYVTVQDSEESVSESVLNPVSESGLEVRKAIIRSARDSGEHIPSHIVVAEEGDTHPDDVTTHSECCGSVLTKISEKEDGTFYNCVCGSDLSTPNYTIKRAGDHGVRS